MCREGCMRVLGNVECGGVKKPDVRGEGEAVVSLVAGGCVVDGGEA